MTDGAKSVGFVEPIRIASKPDDQRRQWIQLVPSGTVKTADDRGPYFVEDPEAIITASFNAAQTTGGFIPVDYDHGIDRAAPEGRPAPAAGWIVEMQARKDGIWGLVEWTPTALKKVLDRDYRFTSPVLACAGKKVVVILRSSLTNNPNLTMVALNAAQRGNPMEHEEFLSKLRAKLSLDANADETTILDRVSSASSESGPSLNAVDPSRYVPIEVLQKTVAELNRINAGVTIEMAEREVERAIHGRKLMPFMRDWAIQLCSVNKPAFDNFIEGAGSKVNAFIDSISQPYFPPERQGELNRRQSDATDPKILANLGLSAEDIAKYGSEGNS